MIYQRLTFECHAVYSYEIVEPPDMRWGIVDENGTWNGMIRMVQYKVTSFIFDLLDDNIRMCNSWTVYVFRSRYETII